MFINLDLKLIMISSFYLDFRGLSEFLVNELPSFIGFPFFLVDWAGFLAEDDNRFSSFGAEVLTGDMEESAKTFSI